MKSQDVCLALLRCESEDEICDLFESVSELKNDANWHPLDNRETNYNVTTNQAATGGKAATELMTNMVDSILTRECLAKGIDPISSDAPKSMHAAVKEFDLVEKSLSGGKIINADKSSRRSFAEKNLIIGVTGFKETQRKTNNIWPCYTFADNGEGQHSSDFKDTFLSLSAGNKKEIPFVQGKYNMGSSGVLGYCGKHWFKLIVSRKYDKTGAWGWTLMRRKPGDGMPVAQYFAIDGEILTFEDEGIYPFKKQNKKLYEPFYLKSGTIVKLYDYHIGRKYKDFRGARETFNSNLIETILPFEILDFRVTPSKTRHSDKKRMEGIDSRIICGMEHLLFESHKDEINPKEVDDATAGEKMQVGTIDHPQLGKIEITAVPLKETIPVWYKPPYNFRIFHSVNGQVQYRGTRGYLSQQCKLAPIKDRVAIFVDSTNLKESAHNDIWKGDREGIRENDTGEIYLEEIKNTIMESESLKEWKQRVSRQELAKAATEETNDLFQKLVDSNPDFVNLLENIAPTIRIKSIRPKKEKIYKGEYVPTFLKLKSPKNKILSIPINKKRMAVAETNAVNDYFTRAENKGELIISSEDVKSKFVIKHFLKDGNLVISFKLVEGAAKVGDTLSFNIGLQDDLIAEPLICEISIKLIEAEVKRRPKPDRPKPGKKEKDVEEHKLGLPAYVLLDKEGGRKILGNTTQPWPDNFNENDGGYITEHDDMKIYYINIDNSYYLKHLVKQKTDNERELATQKYISAMRLSMLCMENALTHYMETHKENGNDAFQENTDVIRTIFAKGAASSALWLTDQLPKLLKITGDTD